MHVPYLPNIYRRYSYFKYRSAHNNAMSFCIFTEYCHTRIWHNLLLVNFDRLSQQSCVTDADEKCHIAAVSGYYNGAQWRACTTPTVRCICTFAVLFSVCRPLILCVRHVSMKDIYTALLGPGFLIRKVYKYSILLVITDIVFIFVRFFFRDCR